MIFTCNLIIALHYSLIKLHAQNSFFIQSNEFTVTSLRVHQWRKIKKENFGAEIRFVFFTAISLVSVFVLLLYAFFLVLYIAHRPLQATNVFITTKRQMQVKIYDMLTEV